MQRIVCGLVLVGLLAFTAAAHERPYYHRHLPDGTITSYRPASELPEGSFFTGKRSIYSVRPRGSASSAKHTPLHTRPCATPVSSHSKPVRVAIKTACANRGRDYTPSGNVGGFVSIASPRSLRDVSGAVSASGIRTGDCGCDGGGGWRLAGAAAVDSRCHP